MELREDYIKRMEQEREAKEAAQLKTAVKTPSELAAEEYFAEKTAFEAAEQERGKAAQIEYAMDRVDAAEKTLASHERLIKSAEEFLNELNINLDAATLTHQNALRLSGMGFPDATRMGFQEIQRIMKHNIIEMLNRYYENDKRTLDDIYGVLQKAGKLEVRNLEPGTKRSLFK